METSKKTIYCFGIAVLDIVTRPVPDPADWKEKQVIESISLLPGGDAANQSIHFASLGYHVLLNASVGNDTNGESVISALAARGVDVSMVRKKTDTQTGTALLLVDDQGGRTVFSMPGAHRCLAKEDLPGHLPADCCAVSIGSLYGTPLAEKDGLEPLLKEAREKGIPVIADLDSGRVEPDLDGTGIRKLLPYVDYLLPSHYDLQPMTGKAAMEEAVAFLKELGVGQVVVKCGEDGARIFGDTYNGTVPAVKVHAVDTTGAGDCMTAAFTTRIVEGDSIEEATRYACAAGTISTLYLGANSVTLKDEEIRELMKRM